ncbi:CaiB/BaiF CoA transferase family protein [Actinomadura madurae]|uniref:CaiB/BaiF CoA transferase family protein n=1 Tax=Actinomadura madurae TaxID=1993 RepID=UPI0024E1B30D|nr:CaiB/BaiF CoA-transferase family protein [Actinomadura madurae]
MTGPLAGVRVVELAGIGPGPFGAMVLADLGAEVVRIDRPGGHPAAWGRVKAFGRGKRPLEIDLKSAAGVAEVLELVAGSDALIEGYRPGTAERLGLGPAECLARNPALVYGRMTGWGQEGPYSATAGHDINFLAVSGVLHAIGREGERPVPPLNLLGDFGGGGMLLALGLVSALFAARRDGRGQVVDAAILDGTALLGTVIHDFLTEGGWADRAGVNLLDGGAPFYDTYTCADGRFVAVGALEPAFYAALVERLGLQGEVAPAGRHLDPGNWPTIRARLTETFATRTRDEWAAFFADGDCCVSPVLSLREAPADAHNRARGVFRERDGRTEPAPAPRFGG